MYSPKVKRKLLIGGQSLKTVKCYFKKLSKMYSLKNNLNKIYQYYQQFIINLVKLFETQYNTFTIHFLKQNLLFIFSV